MACDGLEFLQNKWPIIKDEANKVSTKRKRVISYPSLVNFTLCCLRIVSNFGDSSEIHARTRNSSPARRRNFARACISLTLLSPSPKLQIFAVYTLYDELNKYLKITFFTHNLAIERLRSIYIGSIVVIETAQATQLMF